jgi:hypothetical protein
MFPVFQLFTQLSSALRHPGLLVHSAHSISSTGYSCCHYTTAYRPLGLYTPLGSRTHCPCAAVNFAMGLILTPCYVSNRVGPRSYDRGRHHCCSPGQLFHIPTTRSRKPWSSRIALAYGSSIGSRSFSSVTSVESCHFSRHTTSSSVGEHE